MLNKSIVLTMKESFLKFRHGIDAALLNPDPSSWFPPTKSKQAGAVQATPPNHFPLGRLLPLQETS
jgi:hypothetical protein